MKNATRFAAALILTAVALFSLCDLSMAAPPGPPDTIAGNSGGTSGGGTGGTTKVPVLEGAWLIPGALAAAGLLARRRKP